MRVAVRISQWLFGAVFMFSGLVKCIDPVGTAIKAGDYLQAMGAGGLDNFLLPAAWALCVGEFLIGVYVFWGWKRKPVWWIALLLLTGFTGLTLWLALTDAVSDCGCFGDAVKLSNWATFWKNIVLLALLVVLAIGRKEMWSPKGRKWETIQTLWALFLALMLCWTGTFRLPIIDFRPYRPGVNIQAAMGMGDGAEWEEIYNVIYEKDGKQVEFSLDSLPDEADGWEFVDQAVRRMPIRKAGEESVVQESEPAIKDFFVLNGAGEDITAEFLQDTLYKFVLLSPDVTKISAAAIPTIQTIYDYTRREGYGFTCMTLRDEAALRQWVDRAAPQYPFVFSDATIIETMGRANPTLMLLKEGTVFWKKALSEVDAKHLCNAKLSEQSSGKIGIINRKNRFFGLIILLFAPFVLYLLFKMKTFVFKKHN